MVGKTAGASIPVKVVAQTTLLAAVVFLPTHTARQKQANFTSEFPNEAVKVINCIKSWPITKKKIFFPC